MTPALSGSLRGYLKTIINLSKIEMQNLWRKWLGCSHSLLAQPNGAWFFGKQGLACSKRRSRKLRARPKNHVK
ncbi:hypothetical protein EIKCOROL_01084 [Eikenella corrodens ATCC 23834]|uniref:Uncharacterized protein n=1 Tax=Eikenella corrodens ATCC 23834 TaxID=546274 RepID=C0DUP8_EIKCO|nr:hypothetical protein EIKCOROL_01084 [Eikenella corrodens ATCC 23834]